MSIDPSGGPPRARSAASSAPPTSSTPACDRVVRQVEAIDGWNAARRDREAALQDTSSREDRLAAHRALEVLRRTQHAVVAATAGELAADTAPWSAGGPTAVVAHRHAWFAERLEALLEDRGVLVLASTDNGADALGAVIAGQPDVLLAGDRLAMLPGEALLQECRQHAPQTWRAVQVGDQAGGAWAGLADVVFPRVHPPALVAEALRGLTTTSGALRGLTTAPAERHRRPTAVRPADRTRTVRPVDVDGGQAQLLCEVCGAHRPFLSDHPIVPQIRSFADAHRHDGWSWWQPGRRADPGLRLL